MLRRMLLAAVCGLSGCDGGADEARKKDAQREAEDRVRQVQERERQREQAAPTSSPAETKFGLTEESRRAAFREKWAADQRATREAAAMHPQDPARQDEARRELAGRYGEEVAQRYKLNRAQLAEVVAEGHQKGWPLK